MAEKIRVLRRLLGGGEAVSAATAGEAPEAQMTPGQTPSAAASAISIAPNTTARRVILVCTDCPSGWIGRTARWFDAGRPFHAYSFGARQRSKVLASRQSIDRRGRGFSDLLWRGRILWAPAGEVSERSKERDWKSRTC